MAELARFMHDEGAKVVAVSDSKGSIYSPHGLDTHLKEGVEMRTAAYMPKTIIASSPCLGECASFSLGWRSRLLHRCSLLCLRR